MRHLDDYSMNFDRSDTFDAVGTNVGCTYSYNGYYFTGGCNGAYCVINNNCISGCCWGNNCDNNPQCGASQALAWFWWVIIWTTFFFLLCFLCAAIRRRRMMRARERRAEMRHHSDEHHHHVEEHTTVIVA